MTLQEFIGLCWDTSKLTVYIYDENDEKKYPYIGPADNIPAELLQKKVYLFEAPQYAGQITISVQ